MVVFPNSGKNDSEFSRITSPSIEARSANISAGTPARFGSSSFNTIAPTSRSIPDLVKPEVPLKRALIGLPASPAILPKVISPPENATLSEKLAMLRFSSASKPSASAILSPNKGFASCGVVAVVPMFAPVPSINVFENIRAASIISSGFFLPTLDHACATYRAILGDRLYAFSSLLAKPTPPTEPISIEITSWPIASYSFVGGTVGKFSLT